MRLSINKVNSGSAQEGSISSLKRAVFQASVKELKPKEISSAYVGKSSNPA